jgi:hypothetical protein
MAACPGRSTRRNQAVTPNGLCKIVREEKFFTAEFNFQYSLLQTLAKINAVLATFHAGFFWLCISWTFFGRAISIACKKYFFGG